VCLRQPGLAVDKSVSYVTSLLPNRSPLLQLQRRGQQDRRYVILSHLRILSMNIIHEALFSGRSLTPEPRCSSLKRDQNLPLPDFAPASRPCADCLRPFPNSSTTSRRILLRTWPAAFLSQRHGTHEPNCLPHQTNTLSKRGMDANGLDACSSPGKNGSIARHSRAHD